MPGCLCHQPCNSFVGLGWSTTKLLVFQVLLIFYLSPPPLIVASSTIVNLGQNQPPLPFRGKCIVADLDGTLVPRPAKSDKGEFLSVAQSPTFAPLTQWLQGGGSLVVVSTAGQRIFRQVVDPLLPFLSSSSSQEPLAKNWTTTPSDLPGGLKGAEECKPMEEERKVLSPAMMASSSSSSCDGKVTDSICGSHISDDSSSILLQSDGESKHSTPSSSSQLVVSAFGGASLWFYDDSCLAMREDVDYRTKGSRSSQSFTKSPHHDEDDEVSQPTTTVIENEPSHIQDRLLGTTAVSPQDVPIARELAREILTAFIEKAAEDENFISALSSPKYLRLFPSLIQRRKELGKDVFEETLYAMDQLTAPGVILEGTDSALLEEMKIMDTGSCQHDDDEEGGTTESEGQEEGSSSVVATVGFVLLGIPGTRYEEIVEPAFLDTFRTMGLEIRPQPNSLLLVRKGIDKATALRWIFSENHSENGEGGSKTMKRRTTGQGFDLGNCIAMGDQPDGVDAPLTQFPPMPFVSVATSAPSEETKNKKRRRKAAVFEHIGGEEEGAARFLSRLVESNGDCDRMKKGDAQLLRSVPWCREHNKR